MQGENGKILDANELARLLSDRGIGSIEDLNRLFEPGQYAVIPIKIMERQDISANAKILYAEIASLTKSTGECFATDKYISQRLGVTVRSVQRLMQELGGKSLIFRQTLKMKKGTFRSIFLTWSGAPGYDKNDVPGHARSSYPVTRKCRTKGDIEKERSRKSPLIAKSREKKKELPAVVVSDSEKVVEPFIEIMDIFRKGINPTLNFGHKTHRKAAQDLVAKLGVKEAIFAAGYAVSVQGKPYAPTITTPYALFNKLGDLRAYYKRHHGKDGNGSIAVI